MNQETSKRRFWRRLLIVLAVILTVLVVIDFAARKFIEHKVEDLIVQKLGSDVQPKVEIKGWPLLFSLVSKEVAGVDVTAIGVELEIENIPIELSRIQLQAESLQNVTTPAEMVIGSGEVTVNMTWAEMSSLTGVEVLYVDAGRIQVNFEMYLMDAYVDVSVEARPWFDSEAQEVKISESTATMSGVPVPEDLLDQVFDYAAKQIQLPQIDGVFYYSLDAHPEEVEVKVKLSGLNVSQFQR